MLLCRNDDRSDGRSAREYDWWETERHQRVRLGGGTTGELGRLNCAPPLCFFCFIQVSRHASGESLGGPVRADWNRNAVVMNSLINFFCGRKLTMGCEGRACVGVPVVRHIDVFAYSSKLQVADS